MAPSRVRPLVLAAGALCALALGAGAVRAAPAAGGGTLAATARVAAVDVRSAPAGHVVRRLANRTSDGAPLTFLVRRLRGSWAQVYLPTRPNGALGWVAASAVSLARNPYRVVVSVRAHTLTVRRDGRVVTRQTVAVGKPGTPTPRGRFFITSLTRSSRSSGLYGPYAFGLSAHSKVLQQYNGGDGQVGIHGTDNPAGLGRSISHGCIRVANDGITRLARILPLGTPVDITVG
jgi:lipoprotein-anchoring transpeptidase ErfK/SrfK